MAISFSRPDPSSPSAVASATFTTSRRGFEQAEVRELLRMVAAELARLQEREKFLERELRVAQRGAPTAAVALDEEVVTRLLGEEAARILQTAREAANQIRGRAEEGAARLLREATDEAQRVRQEAEVESARRRTDAAADAESELEMAKQQGRDMVNEARAYRERVLGELARRRELARQQIEQLVHGRDRLVQAFERARLAAVDVMAELTPLGEPTEYVNLAPTTGPVPLMVPASRVDVPAEPVLDQPLPVEAEPVDEVAVDAVEVDAVDDGFDDEPMAPVVSLFAGELDREPTLDSETADGTSVDEVDRSSVDDLFARLRASRADTVAQRAADPEPSAPADLRIVPDADTDAGTVDDGSAADDTASLGVFATTPEAPVEAVDPAELDDTPFTRRDAAITPIIVAGARKLKRVLADEQNDVLSTLRRHESVGALDALVPWESEQVERYSTAVRADLEAAALAGAASVDRGTKAAHRKDITRTNALRPAVDALAAAIVVPLRERLARAVAEADGDNDELANVVRAIYREWKTQRIDEHLDDVVRIAFGRGALAALTPGAPVCWIVDPNGPACPDAEDNALAGALPAGQPFPTDHTCAPAHDGCRCMLTPADR